MINFFWVSLLWCLLLLSQGPSLCAEAFKIQHPLSYTTIEALKKEGTPCVSLLKEPDSLQNVLLLSKGVVINEGGIITFDGKVLKDTQTSLQDQHRLFKNKKRDINTENPLFFKGRLAVLSSPGSENWYHWLLQILPRLIILKESKIDFDRLYVNNCHFPWQISSLKEFLNFLDIPEEKLLIINGDCIIQAETLIVPSVPFIPIKDPTLPGWLKTNLHKIFLAPHKSHVSPGERIYISRASAKTRRIKNEDDLIKELKKLNFKIIQLEELSPYDQAKIFNTAKVIVGPHGSGFANLIFSQKGTKIIEIDHGVSPPRSYYRGFSKSMQCEYSPFYVDLTTEDHLDDDMDVNVKEIRRLIEEL